MGEMPEITVNNADLNITSKVQLTSRLLSEEKLLRDVAQFRLNLSGPSSRRSSSYIQCRKFSTPAVMPCNLLGVETSGMGSARRRLSNVSDVVTRKLSNTIGWRPQVPCQEIVQIGRSLCNQYIRCRLKRSGFLNKKCGLQRLRSVMSLPGGGGSVFREVLPDLLGLGLELERMHPKLYFNIGRLASSAPGGRFTSEKETVTVLTTVSRELFKQEVTWCKVVSLYAIAGGLAVDCVRQGQHEYLTTIVEAMEEILEDDLALWIQERGGWASLSLLVKAPQSECWPWQHVCLLITAISVVIIIAAAILRLIGV